MKTNPFIPLIAALLLPALNFQPSTAFAQGSLTPPGAPAPMMKSLDQVQPRTPISSLPFTISASGSYYLTTNLTAGAGVNGISVTADNVSIDLNGFTLAGAFGFTSSNGVHVAGTIFNLSVRNGMIKSWKHGINAASGADQQFQDLSVISCSSNGITGGNCVTLRCTVNSVTGTGIAVGPGSSVRDCIVQSCTSGGVSGGPGSVIANCTALFCGGGGYGINGSSGCVIKDCASSQNTLGGINAGDGSRISNCTVYNNFGNGIVTGYSTVENCTINQNSGDGIVVSSYSSVMNNSCYSNGSFTGTDIHVTGSYNRIEENHCTFANRGFKIDTSGNIIVKNSAGNNNTNYVIVANNLVGAFASYSNTTNNNNPHANYDF